MKRSIAILLLLAAPSAWECSTALAASDDGVLIVGIGYTMPELRSYAVHYKLSGARESWPFPDPYIGYITHGVWADDPDFQGHETGKVVVKRLKPGNYEFYTIGLEDNTSQGTVYMEARHSFSVPFTIKVGEATYVGDFTGVGNYMVLSDQHERDIPIAQKKMPKLGPVTIAVTDAATLGTSLIRAKEGP